MFFANFLLHQVVVRLNGSVALCWVCLRDDGLWSRFHLGGRFPGDFFPVFSVYALLVAFLVEFVSSVGHQEHDPEEGERQPSFPRFDEAVEQHHVQPDVGED